MELKEFIEETLIQVVEGVKSAQEKAEKSGACISPKGMRTGDSQRYISVGVGNVSIPLTQIDFEIGLTSTEGEKGKSGIGVFLGGIGIGGQGETNTKNVSVTNIKFSVPVLWPGGDVDQCKFYP
jgi:hypothetical protein